MSTVTIYHNPACGTSRNTLAMIRAAGFEPTVVAYLETPPTREELVKLIRDSGLPVREVLRNKGDVHESLKLDNPALSDEQLIDAMMAHPILINRPLVVTERGTRLCRPSELVLDILPTPLAAPFTKEDGEVVIDAQGRRLK